MSTEVNYKDFPIEGLKFVYNGEKYDCERAIERDKRMILQEAETNHKETFDRVYNKETLKPNMVRLFFVGDCAVYGMISYTIDYKEEFCRRLGCGNYYPISTFFKALEPHPFQASICW